MKYTIFYSWQSDLPNNTNRGFIEDVINKSITDFNSNDQYELEVSIDRDTKDVPGSPNISQTLIDKIKKSDAFVADISIVTGNKENGQRLSPNPNVMLELGYAIALLGWDKIILFCNETYGANEDLPFDIRQHRQIKYSLKPDEPKANQRNNLSKYFGKRLVELIESREINTPNFKKPIILPKWHYLNNLSKNKEINISQILTLKRTIIPKSRAEKVKEDIQIAKSIDGKIDPIWAQKLEDYLRDAEDFIEENKDNEITNGEILASNLDKLESVTLSVENDGNAIATDVRVTIELPEWLFAVEDYPDYKIDMPVMPKPQKPKVRNFMHGFDTSSMIPQFPDVNRFNNLNLAGKINRIFACYLKDKKIIFWSDKLLHRHSQCEDDDPFFLVAMPNAPIGEHILNAQVFCSELDDYEEIELVINVQ
jgi:hypothetical protein